MAPIKVQASKSPHAADDPGLLIVTCPTCGFRQGHVETGNYLCRCGTSIDIMPFEGWTAPVRPKAPPELPVAGE